MRYFRALASGVFLLLAIGVARHNTPFAFANATSISTTGTSRGATTVLGWNSKTVISNGGANKRHELHVKQINFKDADGSFKSIDVSLKNSPSGGWEVTSSTFIARFPARSTGLAVMVNNNRFDTRTLKDITASPASQTIQAIGVNDVAGVKMFGDVGNGEQDYVLYPGAYPDADLIFLVWHGQVPRLQKLIRFTSAPATDRDFQFRFAYPDRDVNFKNAGIAWDKKTGLKNLQRGLTITDPVASARGFGQKEYRIWDSSTPHRNSQLINVDISARGGNVYVLTKHIPLAYFTAGKIVFPVYTDTTTTVYPDPDPETSSVDGLVIRNQGTAESFANNRTGAGTSADASNDYAEGGLIYSGSTPYTHFYRGIFGFDKSAVPGTDSITSATLSFKGALGLDNYTQSASIVKPTPASNTALVASDFNIANWDMTQQASDIALSALSGTNYNDFALTATGISNLSANIVNFGTVLSGDRTNTDPGASAGAYSVWNIIKAEHAGTGSDPKLVIVSASGAPTALVATTASSSQINLSWTDNSHNELGFRIYRALNGGSFTWVATTTLNTVSYTDTGLSADQTYTYEVVSYASGDTATSNSAYAITYNTKSNAPSNLTKTVSSTNIILNWTDNSTNEDGFSIERSSDNNVYAVIATTTINLTGSTSYTDIGAGSGTYYYRVRAFNSIGTSGYSNVISNAGIAFDNANTCEDSATSVSCSLNVTSTGAYRMLLAGIRLNNAAVNSIVSVTFDGSPMIPAGWSLESYTNSPVYLYYQLSPAAGTHDVVVNIASAGYVDVTAASYVGVAQEAPETSATSTGSGVSTYSRSLTTSSDGDWVVMAEANVGSVYNLSAATGSRRGSTFPTDSGMLLDSNGPISPAGSRSLAANMSNGAVSWAGVMAAIKPISNVTSAAIAFDKANTCEDYGTSVSCSLNVTSTGAYRKLLVGVRSNSGLAVESVTFDGSPMALIGSELESYTGSLVYLYYQLSPAAGTHNVVVNVPSSEYVDVTAASYVGVAQVAPEMSATSTGSSVSTYSPSLTTRSDGDWVVMAEANIGSVYNLGTVTGTQRGSAFPTDSGMLLDSNGPISPAGSNSLSVNMSNGAVSWASVMAAMKSLGH